MGSDDPVGVAAEVFIEGAAVALTVTVLVTAALGPPPHPLNTIAASTTINGAAAGEFWFLIRAD
ncbi:hypothetical protein [Mycobacterium riyadhense]|uniref:hypothetical protein n=1 Tax=Mycobacterium riyadhense TaxID=486698 RepID=UPI00195000D0|nr:hypothetical protein [Mycobacterium riyadhense]